MSIPANIVTKFSEEDTPTTTMCIQCIKQCKVFILIDIQMIEDEIKSRMEAKSLGNNALTYHMSRVHKNK